MRYFFLFTGFLISSLVGASLEAQDAIAPPGPAPSYSAPDAVPVDAARKAKARDASRRHQSRREQVEGRLRAMLNDFGVDSARQDALVAYLAEEEAGRVAVREATKRLVVAVRKGADAESMRELISSYKAAQEADKARRAAAQTALDAKIGFSQDPRLEAVLWLFGVLGEGQPRLPLGPRVAATSSADASRRVVVGTVENKGAGWIEVREGDGRSERYFPMVRAQETGTLNEGVTGAVRAAKIGDRVRLEWVGNERRRVVKLETQTDFALEKTGAPQNASTKTPKTQKNRTPQLPKAER